MAPQINTTTMTHFNSILYIEDHTGLLYYLLEKMQQVNKIFSPEITQLQPELQKRTLILVISGYGMKSLKIFITDNSHSDSWIH